MARHLKQIISLLKHLDRCEDSEEKCLFEGRAFYRLNQQSIPSRSEDVTFSVLAVTREKTINISENSQFSFSPRMRNLNQKFSSSKYPIRCDLHLMETFRKLFESENYA